MRRRRFEKFQSVWVWSASRGTITSITEEVKWSKSEWIERTLQIPSESEDTTGTSSGYPGGEIPPQLRGHHEQT
jgi:hypothetical protein